LHVAPIGSGARVIEDDRIWTFVSQALRKTLSIEMESAAVAEVAHRQRQHQLDWVVMKGVMDFADHGRDDHFKEFAARASAECLLWFLRERVSTDSLHSRRHRELGQDRARVGRGHRPARHQPPRASGPVVSAAFSPDGTRVVTASWDKSARIWDLRLDEGTLEQWSVIAERSPYVLSGVALVRRTPRPSSKRAD
jgi:WD40 repeat protein